MNTFVKFLLSLSLLFLTGYFGLAQNKNRTTVKGNGNTITKTIETQPYDIIQVVGSMDVILKKGVEGNISITAEENIVDLVSIESSNGILLIKMENNTSINSRKDINIIVPFQEIIEASLVGSGSITSVDSINAEIFGCSLIGSGEINLNIDSKNLDAKVNGSGEMKLLGSVDSFEIKLSGSGEFDGLDLKSLDTEAYTSGSGNVKITATNSLKARVNGSGSIRYSGNPEKNDSKVMGSGSVKSM